MQWRLVAEGIAVPLAHLGRILARAGLSFWDAFDSVTATHIGHRNDPAERDELLVQFERQRLVVGRLRTGEFRVQRYERPH